MSIRVAHCSPHVGAGGLGPAVLKLCAALLAGGNDVRLHVLKPAGGVPPPGVEFVEHARDGLVPALGVSRSMKSALFAEVSGGAEILHAHSLWTMATVYPARATRGTRCRFVHSPHGTLAPWAMGHHKWRKRAFWALVQRRALASVDCFIVSSEKERDEVRALGFNNRIAVVHSGIDVPAAGLFTKALTAPRRLLFLGRVHPVKALDRLIQSWRLVQERFPEWELVVAGEDDGGYLGELKALSSQLNAARVTFPGLVRGDERDAVYQSADLFVLPSHTENFGIAVAEALANGVPAVVSRSAPWKDIEGKGCGWWTETEPNALAECLAAAMAQPAEQLQAMGARGRTWMLRDFSWARAAEMTALTYQWLLGGGNAPEWMG